MELMKPGYVVVIAYTATDGLRVSLESGTPLASGTTPSGVTWQAAKINKDDGHSIYCLHDGSMTLKPWPCTRRTNGRPSNNSSPRYPWFNGGTMPLP